MKNIHKQRLAKLGMSILKNSDGGNSLLAADGRAMKFNMSLFTNYYWREDDEITEPEFAYECGTACCFLGYAPQVFPAVRSYEDWNDVSEYVIGHGPLVKLSVWNFLFDQGWPDNAGQAARRALSAILSNGDMKTWDYSDRFFENLSDEDVLNQLEMHTQEKLEDYP